MIYLDTPRIIAKNHPGAPRCFRGRKAAHLMADTDAELIEYAVSIGMRPDWIQRPGTSLCHFDLTGSRLQKVIDDPRVEKVGLNEMAALVMRKRVERHKALVKVRSDGSV